MADTYKKKESAAITPHKQVRKTFSMHFARFKNASKRLIDKLLFPDNLKCTFCGADIPNFDERPYCDDCAKTLPYNNGHRCEICDQPIGSEATVCDFCQKEKRNFKKAICPFLYEDEVKNAILAFKDSNQRYRAKAFARMIAEKLEGLSIDIITFIPMTDKKLKQRTFNQSQLLAEELGKILQKPVLACFEKLRDVKSQKTLTYQQRRAAMVGTYQAKRVKLSKSQNILIVDDIITTCATVGYCAGLIYPRVNNIYVCGLAREYVRPAQTQKGRKNILFSFKTKK